jgi:hypothetical protein
MEAGEIPPPSLPEIREDIHKLEMPPIFWETLNEISKRDALRSVQSYMEDSQAEHTHQEYMNGFRIGKIGCPACTDTYWMTVGAREPHAD